MKKLLSLSLILFFLSSCATLSTDERRFNADELAFKAGLQKTTVRTEPFILTAYQKIHKMGEPVRIYIEGDGYAWITPTRASGDPTPRDPTGLKLAAQDKFENVIYLARPCQFTPETQNPACEEFYWTNGRFSEEVINSMNQALSFFVEQTKAPGIELVGYSGGAAVAILVAARRSDVQNIRTVAGNLDPEAVNRFHEVSPLSGSLNPSEVASKVAGIPQIHFIGGDDDVIPMTAVTSFFNKMGADRCFQTKTLPDATHSTGWVEVWSYLLSLPVTCREN